MLGVDINIFTSKMICLYFEIYESETENYSQGHGSILLDLAIKSTTIIQSNIDLLNDESYESFCSNIAEDIKDIWFPSTQTNSIPYEVINKINNIIKRSITYDRIPIYLDANDSELEDDSIDDSVKDSIKDDPVEEDEKEIESRLYRSEIQDEFDTQLDLICEEFRQLH